MDSGSIGFVMICAALVFFMTPGLSYFYGGLVRRKNARQHNVCFCHHHRNRRCNVGIVWIFIGIWNGSFWNHW